MKKLIIAFISPLFILCFIWVIVGYIKHGDKITDYNLDMYSIFDNLVDNFKSDFDVLTFDEVLQNLGVNNEINTGIKGLDNFLNTFIDIIGTVFMLPYYLVKLVIPLIKSIWNFIFNPVFIK